MRSAASKIEKASVVVGLGALVAFSGSVAAPLNVSDAPLFLATAVPPNLVMAIDDSGSMDFEVLFSGNDGSAWWRTTNADSGNCSSATGNSFTGCISDGSTDQPASGRLNFNHSGISSSTWKKYTYLFPNGFSNSNDTARRRLPDQNDDHFAIPPIPDFAWARSPDYNTAYFNPAITYEPWVDEGGYTFENSVPTSARHDPVFEATLTSDLTRDLAGATAVGGGIGSVDTTAACTNSAMPGVANNFYFKVYRGMTLPPGTCFRTSNDDWQVVRSGGCPVHVTNGCEVRVDATDESYRLDSGSSIAIRYFPATFYLTSTAGLPTGFGYTGATLAGTAPNGTAMVGYEIKPGNFATAQQYTAAIQNFANWFTYYRKRHQALRAGLGQSFAGLGNMRVSGFTISNATLNVTMQDLDVASNRTALYQDIYHDWIRRGGTPNRNAVANLIRNFQRQGAGAPIEHACQKNFGMLFTDGFSNAPSSTDLLSNVGNLDGNKGAPYADNVEDTMADAIMGAYTGPLRTDLPRGLVPVPAVCNAANPDPRVDCNRDLHMNFYAVTLGTRGILFDPDADPVQDPYVLNPAWPTVFPARHPNAVDDIWHATVNGRGQLLNAKDPTEISTKLSQVLRSIIERTSSASSASVNSGSLNTGTRIYQARFDSANWTGQLLSFEIDQATGALSNIEWDASDRIPDAAQRNIVTINSNGTPVPFAFASLDSTRQAQLDADPTVAQRVLNYLRGDSSNEGTDTGQFRVRRDGDGPNKLGDIVSSSPLFVGAPRFRYRDSLESVPYRTFASARENRSGMIYAGANDGMLHGFRASDGREVFAFIPSPVFSRLRNLPTQNYNHQYFVDGPPSTADVFFGGAWHSVLVGGLNKGGQGIYALDITDPGTLAAAEGNPSSVVLWEFTDANDADLGLTYSQPVVVKLRNGRWAAVFGNGYNSKIADGNASTTGNAVLYIVDIQNGTLISKLDTGAGTAQAPASVTWDNGLSTPTLVDTDGDRIVEYAYAGDLHGNLWKFDLSDAASANWAVQAQPLFQARDENGNAQPITVRPEVVRGPFGAGFMVLFGTGKYLEPSDKLLTPVRPQTFYGIYDRNTGNDVVSGRDVLTRQQIIVETSFDPDATGPLEALDVRITTNNQLGASSGWYIDLVSPSGYQAEKQVTNPIVRNGKVIFTTLIPDADPCRSGGRSWIMELDMLDGSSLETAPFDLNNDGLFNDADNQTASGNAGSGSISGLGSTEGLLQTPGVIDAERGPDGGGPNGGGRPVQYKYLPGTSGRIQIVIENPGAGGAGRQTWRQIR